uniref:Uncharacterized protein n=1 Tax=Solanum lycopersicum TaxID=4081 RepID=A0A3Q7EPK9_SOLLC
MLFSRVDRDSHKFIDAGNRGKTHELIRKKKSRRNHSAPPCYQGKNKFFAMSGLQERQQEITVLRLFMMCPLMPSLFVLECLFVLLIIDDRKRVQLINVLFHHAETRAVSRLHHSAGSFHSSHPINERPSVKRELVNIRNSNLQAQGECTCTHDGELKEGNHPVSCPCPE